MPTPALFTASGAITTQQNAINVISNNIANVNTTGFKSSSITFQEQTGTLLQAATGASLTIGGRNPMEVGSGNVLSSVSTTFSQGSLRSTGVVTDLAIQGNGFFAISPDAQADGSYTTLEFTRDGHFTLDSTGNLVTPLGYKAMGLNFYDPDTGKNKYMSAYSAVTFFTDQPIGPTNDPTMVATDGNTAAGNLDVPTPALVTVGGAGPTFDATKLSELSVRGDLIDNADVNTTTPGDLEVSENSDGKMVFTYTEGSDVYTVAVDTNVQNTDNVVSYTLTDSVSGDTLQLRMRLKVGTTSLTDVFIGVSYNSGTDTSDTITFDGADPETQTGADITVAAADIEFMATADVRALMAPIRVPSFFNVFDPSVEAETKSYTVNSDGTVVMFGSYRGDEGSTQTEQKVARLLMANFINPDGLNHVGHNAYTKSANSGEAAISVLGGPFDPSAPSIAGTSVVSGALESSNVNLADQFAQLIAFQRGLQANGRSFSAADEILQTLINL
jgi:flagellar hook protein FlgE